MERYRIGVDIGGTFTDFTLMEETRGISRIAKIPSTPEHPWKSVIDGIHMLAERYGVDNRAVKYFVHGTTIAINTVIERKGARTGLLITKGFRDVMSLGRQRLPDIFDLLTVKPEPLVERSDVGEIEERTLYSGQIYQRLSDDQVRQATEVLVGNGIEALAISFLHSYRNPRHEQLARQIVEEAFPDLYVCISSETWPQIREYERTLVCVINAYVGRKMERYFGFLEEEVAATGITATILSTKSNGGVMTARSARSVPVETLSSGPSSGVIGAHHLASQMGFDKVIALDMGGTSSEVAVIDREIQYSTENTVGDFEMVVPAVDLNSIGAGGGSIAWADPAGVLKVGPKSAGADPGPACYDRGGNNATITDAYVVTGVLDPNKFLGGELKLNPEMAGVAIDRLGPALGLNRIETAEAIIRVATSNMYSELVPLMARKGVDVSEFSLLTYGGAGPTHGFILAKEVGINKVIVPFSPGTLCALGALVADARNDFISTFHRVLEPEESTDLLGALRERFAELEQSALGWIEDEQISVLDRCVLKSADMRYLGQSFEVAVDLTHIHLTPEDGLSAVRKAFDKEYGMVYGHADESSKVEIINLRATAVGVTHKPELARLTDQKLSRKANLPPSDRSREVFVEGRTVKATVYDRSRLSWGHEFLGPAIVEQYDTTAFVPDGFRCQVDEYGTIIGDAV
jgi:N-methylhydantoinase A